MLPLYCLGLFEWGQVCVCVCVGVGRIQPKHQYIMLIRLGEYDYTQTDTNRHTQFIANGPVSIPISVPLFSQQCQYQNTINAPAIGQKARENQTKKKFFSLSNVRHLCLSTFLLPASYLIGAMRQT